MTEQDRDHSVLRRIYEEILPLLQRAAAGEWVYYQNPALQGMDEWGHLAPESCPARLEGDVRCWQRLQVDHSLRCLPVECHECAVWKAARPTMVEELGEALNSIMYRLCRRDETLARAVDLTRDLASQWEDLELENRAIKESMARDALTGLFNRQQLDLTLKEAIARRQGRQRPLTVAMFDIDHFKEFNDNYGHPQGDRVLAACGRLMEETTRVEDLCFRYGGEEFVVIFQDTPISVAKGIAERLRRRFARLRFEVTGQDGMPSKVGRTISGGLAAYSGDMDAEQLLAAADAALYEAKRSGRNRISVVGKTRQEPAAPLPVNAPAGNG